MEPGLAGVAGLGIGRCLSETGRIVEASDAFTTAKDRFGAVQVERPSGRGSLAGLADAALARLGERTEGLMVGTAGAAPWKLDESTVIGAGRRWLLLEGESTGDDGPRLAAAGEQVMAYRASEEGPPLWTVALGEAAQWGARVGTLVLVATPSRVVGIHAQSGELAWEHGVRAGAGSLPPDPFAPSRVARSTERELSGKIVRLGLSGDRLLLFVGDRTLLALEASTGQLIWSFRASETRLSPHFLVEGGRLLVQVREPNARLVLDAESGEVLHRLDDEVAGSAWVADPVPLGRGRAAMALDPRTVASVDLEAGVTLWESRDRSVLPRYDLPMLLATGDHLVVAVPGQVSRLDPIDGDPLWTSPFGQTPFGAFEAHAVLGVDRLYWLGTASAERSLHAVDLEDGRLVWKRPIGDEASWPDWAVHDLGDVVAVAPRGGPADGAFPSRLPVLICRGGDGRSIQRLLLSSGDAVESVEARGGAVEIVAGDGLFRLISRADPVVKESIQ